MKLLIVRHGPAGDKKKWAAAGKSDAARPLTAQGREKMRRAARGLKRLFSGPAVLADSGLKRSMQTADILAKHVEIAERVRFPDLAPESSAEALVEKLKRLRGGNDYILVGHEPQLSALVGFLTAEGANLRLELKKGGACLIELRPDFKGTLAWALTPKQLRQLAC